MQRDVRIRGFAPPRVEAPTIGRAGGVDRFRYASNAVPGDTEGVSRGLGKLQRQILAAVAEHGTAITTAEIAAIVVRPIEDDGRWLTPEDEAKVRRAVSTLIRTGRLIDVSFGDRHRWVDLP